MSMHVVILAGGKGTRLSESTLTVPKPLVNVAGKPILAHQIQALLAQGFPNIRLSLGHRAEMISGWVGRRWPHIECRTEPEPLGTGGAVKFASEGLKEPFMALNGDIVADFDYRAIADEARTHENSIVGWKLSDARDMGLIEVVCAGRVATFREKPLKSMPGMINAGVYILHPSVFTNTPQAFSIEHKIFPRLAREGRLGCVLHRGEYWFDCGTEKRLEEVRKFLSSR